MGNWLNRGQTEQLLALPDTGTFKGKRDHALLVLFIGAGIRREELSALPREQIQQRDGRWCLVDLIGKGAACGRSQSPIGPSKPWMPG